MMKRAPSGGSDGPPPRDAGALRDLLRRIDGGPWGQYRELVGRFVLGEFELRVDRVPPDPFAGAARIRVSADRESCGLPPDLAQDDLRRLGVEDHLAAEACRALEAQPESAPRGGAGSGRIRIDAGGPAILERSACRITEERVELRLLVDLPAHARRIRGRQADTVLQDRIPRLATSCLLFSSRRIERARAAADIVEDHAAIQRQLRERGLVAFVADGSNLARVAGGDENPRRDGREVQFRSPEELRVRFDLPHAGTVAGLGIPAGVTLIVGGGFHGKSTLLDALARGVHPHRVGDGRERVATVPEAVVIRAEDGRAVRDVDISSFLGELPSGTRATRFTTDKASGSTSQAASIVETLDAGARLLLLDEDRCATNFMVRDGRMQRLVPRSEEPIVPFLDRVRELYDDLGVSTILVTGGTGDYLDVADTVIQMRDYVPRDVTARARELVRETRSMRTTEKLRPMGARAVRAPRPGRGLRPAELRVGPRGPEAVRMGDETVDLRALEQLLEPGQVRALALLMGRAARRMDGRKPLVELVAEIESWLDRKGLDALDSPAAYDLARPRALELVAAINRWRGLVFAAPEETER